jgi:hypothetical protein
MRVTNVGRVITALLLLATLASARDKKKEVTNSLPPELVQAIDNAIQREHALITAMQKYHPMVETYLQNVAPDHELGNVPISDKYFLGRLDIDRNFNERFYMEVSTNWQKRMTRRLKSFYTMNFMPEGFSNMIFVDRTGLDRQHYQFDYLGREFLGQVRCLVFQVSAVKSASRGRFLGRIWVEDQDFNIVRFNGVYGHASRSRYYFHMDSWRSNVQGNEWLPSHVYSEESDMRYAFGLRSLRFKAQTKLWGYGPRHSGLSSEHTDMVVDSAGKIKDDAPMGDVSPVESLRAWQREAENNVVDRMELAGLLAKRGDLEKVLETVVNNLMVTNDLEIEPGVRCRVLLTSPLESFTVGHTIVISRGLLDVLPDESSLAMVLSHELAHIALGHQLDTKYGFGDRVIFRDEQSFKQFNFHQDERQEEQADRKAIELLQNSPYANKLASAGLFLRALQDRASTMRALLDPQLGNSLARGDQVVRMTELMNKAPQLQPAAADQIAALPLGARIKVDLWDDHTEMSKAKSTRLLSAREKMPFEVTPYIPNLMRAASPSLDANDRGTVGDEEPQKNYPRTTASSGGN